MHIAGKIIELLINKQQDHEFQKYFRKVGKAHSAKQIINVMHQTVNMALLQGDHQPETKWYNYDEEVEEPLPC